MRLLNLVTSLWRSRAARRSQPRPRVMPWRKTRSARALAVAVPVLIVGGVGLWGWQARWPERAADWSGDLFDQAMTGLGFAVNEVWVIGRTETPRDALIEAIGVETGAPILTVDLVTVRDRVRALPWVRDAAVRRILPATLVVEVTERRPLARWQNDGRYAVIDATGTVLTRRGLERFSDLPIVVGGDAPPHAARLITLLQADPDLYRRVRAAVRFGGRRWNVHLDGDVVVRLPELDAEAAWLRLADHQRRHGVLDRDVRVLDLRFPDQIIVRRREAPDEPPPTPGRDT